MSDDAQPKPPLAPEAPARTFQRDVPLVIPRPDGTVRTVAKGEPWPEDIDPAGFILAPSDWS